MKMPPKQEKEGGEPTAKKKRRLDKESEEYKARRERNNIAVRKSRDRSRAKAKETDEKLNDLRRENSCLEQKVEILSKELTVLKDLFLQHANDVSAVPLPLPGEAQVNTIAVQNDHEYSAHHHSGPS
jgi:CCAAT/enhancer binding protein (C/EBP) gamma